MTRFHSKMPHLSESARRQIEAAEAQTGRPSQETAPQMRAEKLTRPPLEAEPVLIGDPIEYPITPVGKPRMTQRDRWKKRPAVLRYRAFCDQARKLEIEVPNGSRVTFVLPMPRSWSAALRLSMNGRPHLQRPDVDNLLKALLDAVYAEDATVYDVHPVKRWGHSGAIIVEVTINREESGVR